MPKRVAADKWEQMLMDITPDQLSLLNSPDFMKEVDAWKSDKEQARIVLRPANAMEKAISDQALAASGARQLAQRLGQYKVNANAARADNQTTQETLAQIGNFIGNFVGMPALGTNATGVGQGIAALATGNGSLESAGQTWGDLVKLGEGVGSIVNSGIPATSNLTPEVPVNTPSVVSNPITSISTGKLMTPSGKPRPEAGFVPENYPLRDAMEFRA